MFGGIKVSQSHELSKGKPGQASVVGENMDAMGEKGAGENDADDCSSQLVISITGTSKLGERKLDSAGADIGSVPKFVSIRNSGVICKSVAQFPKSYGSALGVS